VARYARHFDGTDARFSFYFPPAEQFLGRFYQNTHQLPAASQREGDPKTPYARVQNLARVRVVVK